MALYLIRHGKDNSKYCGGWSKYDILQEGIIETERLSRYLRRKQSQFRINKIISSDLLKAKHTAEIINSEFELEVEYSPVWREVNIGDLTDMEKNAAAENYPGLSLKSLGYEGSFPNGESPQKFHDRINDAFEELVNNSSDGENILLITHSGVIEIIYHIVSGLKWDNRVKFMEILPTTIFTIVQIEGGYRITVHGCEDYIRMESKESHKCPKCNAVMIECCLKCGYMKNGTVVDVKTTTKSEIEKDRINAFIDVNVKNFYESRNIPAVFLGPFYFLYRKMYVTGAMLLVLEYLLLCLIFWISSDMGLGMVGFIILWIHIWVRGLLYYSFTNSIYLPWVKKQVKKLNDVDINILKKKGGVSILPPVVALSIVFLTIVYMIAYF